jgi:hypothetical protein
MVLTPFDYHKFTYLMAMTGFDFYGHSTIHRSHHNFSDNNKRGFVRTRLTKAVCNLCRAKWNLSRQPCLNQSKHLVYETTRETIRNGITPVARLMTMPNAEGNTICNKSLETRRGDPAFSVQSFTLSP